MEPIFDEIVRRCNSGQRVALCIVVATRGSTPQGKGAKMIVLADGKTIGTLGGGCVEAEVRKRALELLERNSSQLLEFKLDHDFGWDDGLICGGVMEIFTQIIGPDNSTDFASVARAIHDHVPIHFQINYEKGGAPKKYVEEIGPPPTLLIAGAGHVGQALGEIAAKLDFNVTVIDDRAEFALPSRFPSAKKCIVGDIEQELRNFPIDAGTYIVIVTRGHKHDGQALAAVIDSPAKYIGLIGSKSKIKLIYDDLSSKGVSSEKLLRVHAPIGYDIGAITVPEIAVSIAAQMIAVRRGKPPGPVRALKMENHELEAWLKREK